MSSMKRFTKPENQRALYPHLNFLLFKSNNQVDRGRGLQTPVNMVPTPRAILKANYS